MKGKIVLIPFPFTDLIIGEIGEIGNKLKEEVNAKLSKAYKFKRARA